MLHGRKWTGLSLVAGAAAVIGFASSPAQTQAQEVPSVNQGAIELTLGADVVTEYWFRGIGQQNEGLIVQPFARVDVELPETAGLEPTLYVGTWNSVHDRGDKWYESDLFAGVAAEVADGFTVDLAFTHYRNPANDATFASEVAVGVGYDDEAMMAEYGLPAMNPYALLAMEIAGAATGDNSGTYLELGVAPEFTVVEDLDFPVTLTVPATVGINVNNYYQDDLGRDSTFGFFDLGFRAGVPLRFIPREYGDWTASAGVHLLWLGRSTKRLSEVAGTGDANFNTYGTVGFSMEY